MTAVTETTTATEKVALPEKAAESAIEHRAGLLRRWRPSTVVRDSSLGQSGIFNSQTWVERTPWRPAAAWAAMAGLLAAGLLPTQVVVLWPTLVLLLLLVDLFWSSIWRLAAGRAELLPLREYAERPHITLPYLRPDSAAAQLLDRNSGRVLPVLTRVGLPSVLLALFVASALGVPAVGLTLAVVAFTAAGWITTRRSHRLPVLLNSLVGIGLPWLLAAWLLLGSWPTLLESGQLLLMALWVLHSWGAGRLRCFEDERFGLLVMAAADIGILLLLIWSMAPLWLVFWLLCTLPTWLLVYWGKYGRRVEIWHLGAMLVSATGFGQIV